MQCRSSKLKGRCQSLPGNIWDIWFLSCFSFSLSTRLSFGWKTAVTVNRYKHDQHSLPLNLQVCSLYQSENIFVINFECSTNTSQLGTLKQKTIKQHVLRQVIEKCVCPMGQQRPPPLNVSPGKFSYMHIPTNGSLTYVGAIHMLSPHH